MGRDVIVIVHAYGGSPKKFWYPALCKSFDSEAMVIVLYMPGGAAPVISEWLSYLQAIVQEATTQESAKLYLVGHSLGCNAILRMLAAENAAATLRCLRGVLCVAGWLSIDEPWLEMEPWCHPPRPDGRSSRSERASRCSSRTTTASPGTTKAIGASGAAASARGRCCARVELIGAAENSLSSWASCTGSWATRVCRAMRMTHPATLTSGEVQTKLTEATHGPRVKSRSIEFTIEVCIFNGCPRKNSSREKGVSTHVCARACVCV